MSSQKTIIIAEAGVNHNGSIGLAKELIDVASECGADFVKFQTFKAENLAIKNLSKAEYQKGKTNLNESQFEMLKKLELDVKDHQQLIKYCKKNNIQFLSTPFDFESIKLLEMLGIPIFKVPSGEITNLPYLQMIGRTKKPIIMSTGMSTLNEIHEALKVLLDSGAKKEKTTILHCNSEYPTPMDDVNLNAMITIKNDLGVNVGYSDHTQGIEIPIAAVALGAKVIEKHFTLDRKLFGPDHAMSIEPEELKAMVIAIRNVEVALGDGIKKPTQSELKNINLVRKSIVASKVIKKGEPFSQNNLAVKRSGDGISPMEWDSVIKKTATQNFEIDDLIK